MTQYIEYSEVYKTVNIVPRYNVTYYRSTLQRMAQNHYSVEFFTIPPQYKNANVANFILAEPFKIKKTNKVFATLKGNSFYQLTSNLTFANILRSK